MANKINEFMSQVGDVDGVDSEGEEEEEEKASDFEGSSAGSLDSENVNDFVNELLGLECLSRDGLIRAAQGILGQRHSERGGATIEKLEDEESMQSLMSAMDGELYRQTKAGDSFVRSDKVDAANDAESDDEEEVAPVSVDANLVSHFVESYQSQMGLPGPASTLLGKMKLPNAPRD